MRRGHEGADVLHLHAGLALENEGGPRARVCRAAGRRASRTCRVWRSRRRFCIAEALENNLDDKVKNERWGRWHTCSLCEQEYHGVVKCALGWACWKTNLGRPETDDARMDGNERAWGWFIPSKTPRGGVVRVRGRVGYACGALAHRKTLFSCAEQSSAHVTGSDETNEALQHMRREVYSGFLEAPWRGT